MSTKTTFRWPGSGMLFLFFAFIFLGNTTTFAMENGGGGCDNEITISGDVKSVISNNGVQYAYKIKGAPNAKGARFYDNNDRLVVKLDALVEAGENIVITWKKRNYNSSYSKPSKLKVYVSENGSSYSYHSTVSTHSKYSYVQKTLTLNDDTRYIKLKNASSSYCGFPDFLVDAVTYSYKICNDVCLNGPEPGTPCDDGNANTSGDVINDNCECAGTPVGGTFTVCAQIDNSRDDAEEAPSGAVSTSSSDLELVLEQSPDPDVNQIVGLRFNNLNIPQGAVITSAFIQFTADATIDYDPCDLNIYGEASDNASVFSTANGDISGRAKTAASILWSPEDWYAIGDAGAAQQTDDLSTVVQEIVNRPGFNENSSIAMIIDGIGKRTAVSFDGNADQAPILCVTFQTGGCQDSDGDGVCNEDDRCEGYDDNVDVDNDGTPDGCDECINEVHVSGHAVKVLSNCGVSYSSNVLGAPDDQGAKFFDHGDYIIVKLDDIVEQGQKITIRLKRRDYNSSYSGPSELKVYESKHGYCFSYNKTIITEVKSYYVDKMFTVDGDTKYLKLKNGSSCYNGSPDFYVDAVSYDYTLCDEVDHCPNGPEPGTACDDGNPNTINDVINSYCECAGTVASNFDVCSQIENSSDDAEENTANGAINLTSGDLEFLYDNGNAANQVVGLRFLNLNIPQGAVVNNAYIQFTSEATINQDPSSINIYGEASDDAATFANSVNNISNRAKTSAFVNWSPPQWQTTGSAGPDQQTLDLSEIIQEIVDRPGYSSSSAISIIIDGIGKRTAVSFDANADEAAELCINYSAPLQGGAPQGMMSFDEVATEAAPQDLGVAEGMAEPEFRSEDNGEEDAPEVIEVDPVSVNVFPVPASRDLNVNLSEYEGQSARISVYNQIGQLVEVIEVDEVSASPVQMSVGNYQNGSYFMSIELENAKPVTKQFLVNRMY